MEMKNHEGYHDPTAGKAIRRADRVRQRGRGASFHRPLMYKVGDLPGFLISVVALGLAEKR